MFWENGFNQFIMLFGWVFCVIIMFSQLFSILIVPFLEVIHLYQQLFLPRNKVVIIQEQCRIPIKMLQVERLREFLRSQYIHYFLCYYFKLRSHFPKWSKFQRLGSISGRWPHAVATIATLAICGPKYRTKVWSPVPNPIEDATPSMIQ